ncbi:MAG: hypothetical protein A3J55_02655 [Candidatus Ryanbacteria bacterium RIFCSPHIGHO2_02_FULL_45_17b]|nr:MAG: hypothetical protein A3J55_02655 [Candidatus Ryanbacteria bacterium RIFCSPHIGHO2_02_FULL_45_17b]
MVGLEEHTKSPHMEPQRATFGAVYTALSAYEVILLKRPDSGVRFSGLSDQTKKPPKTTARMCSQSVAIYVFLRISFLFFFYCFTNCESCENGTD